MHSLTVGGTPHAGKACAESFAAADAYCVRWMRWVADSAAVALATAQPQRGEKTVARLGALFNVSL